MEIFTFQQSNTVENAPQNIRELAEYVAKVVEYAKALERRIDELELR